MPLLFFFKIDLDTDFFFWSGITEVGFALCLIQLKYMKQRVLDIEQWQNRTVIPERRETNEVNFMIASVYCLEGISKAKEEPKQCIASQVVET